MGQTIDWARETHGHECANVKGGKCWGLVELRSYVNGRYAYRCQRHHVNLLSRQQDRKMSAQLQRARLGR